jgi:tetratricopeptide (TPR) repeat protein
MPTVIRTRICGTIEGTKICKIQNGESNQSSWYGILKRAENEAFRLEEATQILKYKGVLLLFAEGGYSMEKGIQRGVLESMDLSLRVDAWLFAVTLLYRVTPEQFDGCPLTPYWKVFQQWLPYLQNLLTYARDDSLFPSEANVKSSTLLAYVIQNHSWYLYEHGRYQEASNMLQTARWICECLMREINTGQDIKVSMQSLKHLLSDICSTQASIALERNSGEEAVEGWKEVRRLRREAQGNISGKLNKSEILSRFNLASADAVLGKPKEAIESLRELDPLLSAHLQGKSLANQALCHLRENDIEKALETITKALEREKDKSEIARFDPPSFQSNTPNICPLSSQNLLKYASN